MTETTVSSVCMFLDSYGWKYEVFEKTKILTRFLGEKSDTQFNLIISVSEHWIGLTVWPYLLAPPKEKLNELYKRVCQLNFDLKLARLSLADTGETALCVDIPTLALDEALFHLAMDTITYYADSLYLKLLDLWVR